MYDFFKGTSINVLELIFDLCSPYRSDIHSYFLMKRSLRDLKLESGKFY